MSLLSTIKAQLWTQAVPEQRKLTIQLVRNSGYFVAAALVIRYLGDFVVV